MCYIWGKTSFEKTCPKEFFDAFMMIWVWKSGFNNGFFSCIPKLWDEIYTQRWLCIMYRCPQFL